MDGLFASEIVKDVKHLLDLSVAEFTQTRIRCEGHEVVNRIAAGRCRTAVSGRALIDRTHGSRCIISDPVAYIVLITRVPNRMV